MFRRTSYSRGGGFKYFLIFDLWGNDPISRAYFSIGLVQPPTSSGIMIQTSLGGLVQNQDELATSFPEEFQYPKGYRLQWKGSIEIFLFEYSIYIHKKSPEN